MMRFTLTLLAALFLVDIASAAEPVQPIPAADAIASQSFTAVGTLQIPTNGVSTVMVAATGTGSGMAIQFNGSVDGVNWSGNLYYVNVGGNFSFQNQGLASNGFYIVNAAGWRYLRVNLTAITGGTETFIMEGSPASPQLTPIVGVGGLPVVASPNETFNNQAGVAVVGENEALNAAGSWDRWRNNQDLGSVVTPGTTSQTGTTQTNYNARGVVCIISITAFSGTSIVFTLKGRDTTDGVDYAIGATAALTTTGIYRLEAYPGITATSSSPSWTFSDVLPRFWHLDTADTSVTAITATDDCQEIL